MQESTAGTSKTPVALLGALCGLAIGGAALSPLIVTGRVPARLDLADFFWPLKLYTAACWRAGTLPLWNPLSGCGEPWLAQLQSGVLYPPDLVFLLPFPAAAWVAILLHAAIGAAGMAAYLRDLGSSRGAALAGAGLFVGSGAFVSLIPVLNNAWTAAWLPWVLLAARRAVTGGSGAGLAVSAALAFLGGEPLLALAGTIAAVALALFARPEDRPLRKGGWRATGAGLLLACGLVCAVAWPFGELLSRSGRLGNVGRGEAMSRALQAGDLGDLVAAPRAEATRRVTPGRGGYLVSLAGAPLLFLLAAGAGAGFPGRRRLLLGLSAMGVCGLLAALGPAGGGLPALWDSGLLRGVRFPARWFVFTHLALSVAAAAGWDGWLHGQAPPDDPEGRRERRAARIAAVAAVVALAGVAFCALATAGTRDPLRTAVAGAATLFGGGLLLRARRRGAPLATRSALLLAVLGPLPLLAHDPLDGVDAGSLSAPPAIAAGIGSGRIFSAGSDPWLLAAFSESGGSWDEGTPLAAHALLAGYANLSAGIPNATSASPIRDARLTRLLGAALAGGNAGTLFALADVRHLITPFPTRIPGARLVREVRGVRRYALPPGAGRYFFPRAARLAPDDMVLAELKRPDFSYEEIAFVASSPVALPPARGARGFAVGTVLAEAPERIEIATSCSDPGLLVLTRSWDAGWIASVDDIDAPALRADLAFLAVPVPAGEHRVVLEYRPRSWRIGRVVSGASLVLVAILWVAAPRRTAP